MPPSAVLRTINFLQRMSSAHLSPHCVVFIINLGRIMVGTSPPLRTIRILKQTPENSSSISDVAASSQPRHRHKIDDGNYFIRHRYFMCIVCTFAARIMELFQIISLFVAKLCQSCCQTHVMGAETEKSTFLDSVFYSDLEN
ncbi:hypothetical protein TcasGA2_TC016389 [Tribolium castaneum]|uniref:Uncharacterized protein n=1 Tax=Tribolium castaneum TaxID=7070 RepID=D2CFY0_TRICA|nr:hypothetical protein TcasGA2_TC016389 [Tribolium castaneum]